LENLGIDGRVLLKCIFKKWDGGMDWFGLGMDTHRCRTFVDGVMNLRVSQSAKDFSTSWEHISFSSGCVLQVFNYTYNSCLN
jgi:hypothetical protein